MWTLTQINRFEEIIDVRSPTEYSIDHIPGACSCPVLNDKQRAEVGEIYKQISSLEAKKHGAAMVAENVSKYLKTYFHDRDDDWHPLVYCWRGGMRSAALTHILREIGWQAEQLPGGYKAYRKTVIQNLENIPLQFHFKVLCGCTGSGKSLLLASLAKHGAQTIDLEALANHRGSVLGAPVKSEQPSQKHFESQLCQILCQFDPTLPIYIESESRRIGNIQVPTALLKKMRSATCINIEVNTTARTKFLISEYQHFLKDHNLFKNAIQPLALYVGKNKVENWLNWRKTGGAENLVRELLQEHYDPLYLKSMSAHFSQYKNATIVHLDSINTNTLNNAARNLVEQA